MRKENYKYIHYLISDREFRKKDYKIDNIIKQSKLLEAEINRCISDMKKRGIAVESGIEYLNSIVEENTARYLKNLEGIHMHNQLAAKSAVEEKKKLSKEIAETLLKIEDILAKKETNLAALIHIYEKSNPLLKTLDDERKEVKSNE